MSADINSIKRKVLIKYPTFGSIIANLEIQDCRDIATAGTDGKVLLYNPKFLGSLSEKQQIFIFAHEICHVAFEHIFRSEGKDKVLWNIATDAVINALLKQDGLPIVEGAVDIPEAINYDAEEMYNKLLEEQKNQEQQSSQSNQGQQSSQSNQEQQNSQGNQGQQSSQSNQEQQNSQSNQEQQSSQSNQEQQSSQSNQEQQSSQSNQEQQNSQGNQVGHDTHSLWDKAIEERKEEQQKQGEGQQQEQTKNKENDKRKRRGKGEKKTRRKIKIC